MNQDLLSEINSLSDGNIDFFIQFWSDRINIENADVEPMQADILFYLNSLKHFKAKVEEMQKALEFYAEEGNYKVIESQECRKEIYAIKDSGYRARKALEWEELK